MDLTHVWAVVPAGGAGTRLWPLSRAAHPKFLLDLAGSGRSLLQDTVARVRPLVDERVLVVTGTVHAEAVRRQLTESGVPSDHVLAEPSARDSMAAIGWAAAVLEARDPEAVLCSLAADHVIEGEESLHACLREAVAAAGAGYLVTIGIEPTHAATGFGYIEMGEALPSFETTRQVRSFVEKPDAARAAEYLASGAYRWNGGMFVVKARVLLDLLAEQLPEMAACLRAIAADPTRLEGDWDDLPRIAIDHAVAEPAADLGRVVCVPGTFGWDDVGDFAALRQIHGEDLVVQGSAELVQAIDTTGLVIAKDRPIAVLGMSDVVVVDTGDAVLVTTMEHAQRVKDVVAAVKNSGRVDLA